MFENKSEKEAREQILASVEEYCNKYHNQKTYKEGDRIPYASRYYGSEEMVNLVDSSLEFWLTAGRYTEKFEKEFAEYLGVRFCSLVNSGSSANLNAFMALTSPLLGDRQVKPGDEAQDAAAEKIYRELMAAGVEVLLDDRDERPGVKFKDADLRGIPVRITVGKRAPEGIVEYKLRRDADKSEKTVDEAIADAIAIVNAEK